MESVSIIPGTQQSFSFVENDVLRSVAQNIALLFSTKKGTVPCYREFGIPMKFIDKPEPIAKTLIMSEAVEAAEIFEPRAEIRGISFVTINEKTYPKIEVSLKDAE